MMMILRMTARMPKIFWINTHSLPQGEGFLLSFLRKKNELVSFLFNR